MVPTKTRSIPTVWLLGKPDKNILGSGLRTNGTVIKNMFRHEEKQLEISKGAELTTDDTLTIWKKCKFKLSGRTNVYESSGSYLTSIVT